MGVAIKCGGNSMTISTGDILGHSQVGVYLSVVGNNLFYPASLDKSVIEEIAQVFDIEMNPLLIGGSALIGSLICGNSKGIAVADIATEEDLDILSSYGEVVILESGVNAAGNLLECNDFGAVVSKSIPNPGVELIGEILGVKTSRVRVSGQDTVGSLLVANNKGILAHPDITSYEVSEIEKTMDVPVMVGTVCFGSPYVGAGCVTSDTNALVGSGSTGPELNRIEDALGLI
jgi:translation initiation factor 6